MGNGAKFAIHVLQKPISSRKEVAFLPAQIGGRFELSQIQDQCDDRLPGTVVQFACNPPPFFILELHEFRVELASSVGRLAISHIAVYFEPAGEIAACVSHRCPTAGHRDLGAIPPGVDELSLPTALFALPGDFGEWDWKNGMQQVVRILANGLCRRPSVKAFGAFVPISNGLLGAANKDGIIGGVQPLRLRFYCGRFQ